MKGFWNKIEIKFNISFKNWLLPNYEIIKPETIWVVHCVNFWLFKSVQYFLFCFVNLDWKLVSTYYWVLSSNTESAFQILSQFCVPNYEIINHRIHIYCHGTSSCFQQIKLGDKNPEGTINLFCLAYQMRNKKKKSYTKL